MKSILGGSQCDSVTVELRQTSSPYNAIVFVKSVVSTTGICNVNLSGSYYGGSFYITVSARNSLKCWSANPVTLSQTTNYFFNTSDAQSYGSNSKNLGDGNFALFSGDINQDDKIDALDLSQWKVIATAFPTGYSPCDLNGDTIVDSPDNSLLENNARPLLTTHP